MTGFKPSPGNLKGLFCRRLLLCLALLLLGACSAQFLKAGCLTRACTLDYYANHPLRQLDFWQEQMALPLRQRVFGAPAELVDFVDFDNYLYGYPLGVRAASDAEQFIDLVKQALAGIPDPVLALFENKLAGVFIVEGLGSTGFSDYLKDADGEPVAGWIMLDASALDKAANRWASWKDATAFTPAPGFEIRVTLEQPAEDNQVNAIQFILLHELAHVLSAGSNFHPGWWLVPAEDGLNEYAFARLSWNFDSKQQAYSSLYEEVFPLRSSLRYYRQPALSAAQMVEALQGLQQTNFVSLYAATSIGDDFAETFAIYVHTELMNKPYRVEVLKDGQSLYSVESCLQDRCREKLDLLEALLN